MTAVDPAQGRGGGVPAGDERGDVRVGMLELEHGLVHERQRLPEMISEVAAKLRKAAGLPKKPTGVVANGNGKGNGVTMKVKESVR